MNTGVEESTTVEPPSMVTKISVNLIDVSPSLVISNVKSQTILFTTTEPVAPPGKFGVIVIVGVEVHPLP